MTGNRFLKIFVAVVFIILAGFTVNSYAGTPAGRVCLGDSFGGTWVLDYGTFGTENFDVTGFRLGATCNGTAVQPVTGTATATAGNNVVLGVMTLTNEVDVCATTSWNITVSLDTLSGASGAYTNMFGSQGTFTMSAVACPGAILSKEMGDGITNDPARIQKSNK